MGCIAIGKSMALLPWFYPESEEKLAHVFVPIKNQYILWNLAKLYKKKAPKKGQEKKTRSIDQSPGKQTPPKEVGHKEEREPIRTEPSNFAYVLHTQLFLELNSHVTFAPHVLCILRVWWRPRRRGLWGNKGFLCQVKAEASPVFVLSPAVKSLYGLKLVAQALAFQSCVSARPRFEVFMRSRAYGWPLTLSPVFLLRPVLRSLYGLKLVAQASAFSPVFLLLPDLRYFYGLKLVGPDWPLTVHPLYLLHPVLRSLVFTWSKACGSPLSLCPGCNFFFKWTAHSLAFGLLEGKTTSRPRWGQVPTTFPKNWTRPRTDRSYQANTH